CRTTVPEKSMDRSLSQREMLEIDTSLLREELRSQSMRLFGIIGLGGHTGPTMEQYDRLRERKWPMARVLLKRFGLPCNYRGWVWLLMAFGFMPPTPSDIQVASHRHRETA